MNQLTETLKSMEGMTLPDKTTFGTYNYLTPGPTHPAPKRRIEKLARRLKMAADSLEDVPKLSILLLIISASLMGAGHTQKGLMPGEEEMKNK